MKICDECKHLTESHYCDECKCAHDGHTDAQREEFDHDDWDDDEWTSCSHGFDDISPRKFSPVEIIIAIFAPFVSITNALKRHLEWKECEDVRKLYKEKNNSPSIEEALKEMLSL